MPFLNKKLHRVGSTVPIIEISKEIVENENGLAVVKDVPHDLLVASSQNHTHYKEFSLQNQLNSGEEIKHVSNPIIGGIPDFPDVNDEPSTTTEI